ncbi:hypothetical protein J6590_067297 [Homalodisca vitripennis]|nr:hypothetical protein J6590_067297 [Homalodisca vitripennis]
MYANYIIASEKRTSTVLQRAHWFQKGFFSRIMGVGATRASSQQGQSWILTTSLTPYTSIIHCCDCTSLDLHPHPRKNTPPLAFLLTSCQLSNKWTSGPQDKAVKGTNLHVNVEFSSSSPSSYEKHLKSDAVAGPTPEIWSHCQLMIMGVDTSKGTAALGSKDSQVRDHAGLRSDDLVYCVAHLSKGTGTCTIRPEYIGLGQSTHRRTTGSTVE